MTSPCDLYTSQWSWRGVVYLVDLMQPVVHGPERSPDRVRKTLWRMMIRQADCVHL
jgi:hypothetical protein